MVTRRDLSATGRRRVRRASARGGLGDLEVRSKRAQSEASESPRHGILRAGLIGELASGEPAEYRRTIRLNLPEIARMLAPVTLRAKAGVLYVTRARAVAFLGTTFRFPRIASNRLSPYTATIFSEAAEKRRMDEDLAVAHEIQKILLPASAPELPGYQISGLNIPARKVSGDYYDYIPVDPDHCGIVIADVSGKGIPASLIMAMCRSVLRSQASTTFRRGGARHQRPTFPDIKKTCSSVCSAILDARSPRSPLSAGHEPRPLPRAGPHHAKSILPGRRSDRWRQRFPAVPAISRDA